MEEGRHWSCVKQKLYQRWDPRRSQGTTFHAWQVAKGIHSMMATQEREPGRTQGIFQGSLENKMTELGVYEGDVKDLSGHQIQFGQRGAMYSAGNWLQHGINEVPCVRQVTGYHTSNLLQGTSARNLLQGTSTRIVCSTGNWLQGTLMDIKQG